MARSIAEERPARASGALALHVLEIMEAILASGSCGLAQTIEAVDVRPPPLTEDEANSLQRQT